MPADPRLLVVDDEESVCQGCQRFLSTQGYRVEATTDACLGLELAKKNDYDIVLVDMRMPLIDGATFLARLRSTKPNVPVIAITGFPSVSNAQSAIRLGVSDYLIKPFTPAEIVTAVSRLID